MWGKLAVSHARYGCTSGEVTVRGSVVYHGQEYHDLPILILRIFMDKDVVRLQDIWYTARIPRLEAIAEFRNKLRSALLDARNKMYPTNNFMILLMSGIDRYVDQLSKFHQGISLIRALRHTANALKDNSLHDWALARDALYALEVVPAVDVELIVRD
ncbi:MAG: hypothetical protein WAU28_00870 [Candidatus Moraniibacteriota bacterium]